MTNLVNLRSKSDVIGGITSTLCFLHCLAAPFLFAAQAGMVAGEESHPWWWGTLDTAFLAISFFAVYWSAKKTSKPWVKRAFWSLWLLLALIIVNEKFELMHLVEEIIYLPTVALILLHFYNRHFCRCNDDNCCAD
ncbi:MerC domain-containing protein [Flagellimonas sp. CMM7]|uniref:MerC domain-containing protein n=1 Tax=Flagellimonas sp. CMM7 TaxID=2654676 RepID=UPI0013CF6D2B|nr:MerC domain-containing protein [Flagellimonas sp. CMM7]UII81297.1 MerC domain-containing protein [Flagellimonas sp. CMM7]